MSVGKWFWCALKNFILKWYFKIWYRPYASIKNKWNYKGNFNEDWLYIYIDGHPFFEYDCTANGLGWYDAYDLLKTNFDIHHEVGSVHHWSAMTLPYRWEMGCGWKAYLSHKTEQDAQKDHDILRNIIKYVPLEIVE